MKNITIGLITHKNSKYKLNNFKPIFNLVKRNNRQIQLVIEDEDKIIKLKINVLRATLFHYKFLRVQYRWFKFILPSNKKMHYCLIQYLSILKKIAIFIILYLINPKFRENEIKNWKRIMNINYSHFRIITKGLNSNCNYLMILEDDAELIKNELEFADFIVQIEFLKCFENNPILFDLAKSLPYEAISADHLIPPPENSKEYTGNKYLENFFIPYRPFTNTVCAILYNYEFLKLINPENPKIRKMIAHAIPIDWIMNMVLLDTHRKGAIKAKTVHMRDPFFRQLSIYNQFHD